MQKQIIGVTGATGFIGRNLVRGLLDNANHKVKALVLEKEPNLPAQVDLVKGNLVNGRGLDKFLQDVDILIHLAARVLPPEEKMFSDNVVATHNLVTEAAKFPLKHIIYNSTAAVYGGGNNKIYKESDPCIPDTEYGMTKYLSEELVRYWSKVTKGKVTILRPFNVYGPGNFKGVVHSFYKSIKESSSVVIYGDGKQERDFLYVDDMVSAIINAVRKKQAGTFNVVSGKTHTILEVFEEIQKILDKKIKVNFKSADKKKVSKIQQNPSFAKKELGWEAKTGLKEGIKKTIFWYEDNIK